MFFSWFQDKQTCVLKYLETRTPGCERTSVRAGDLNDLSASWEVVYQLYSLKIIIKAIKTKRSSHSTRKKVIFPLGTT